MLPYLEMCTDHVYTSPPTSSLISVWFFAYFTAIYPPWVRMLPCLEMCIDHVYIALQPHPAFFSDFLHILQLLMIANVTIFENVRTDHVYTSPPTSSLIFFWLFAYFIAIFHLWLPMLPYLERCPQTMYTLALQPYPLIFFWFFFSYFTAIFTWWLPMLPYLEMCAQTMCTLALQPHPFIFFWLFAYFTAIFSWWLRRQTKVVNMCKPIYRARGRMVCICFTDD